MELSGKVALVTGGAGNLGAACARELGRQGAKVVVADLPNADVETVAADIQRAGGEALAHHADVRSEAEIVAMVEAASGRFGSVDVLVNVAAAMHQTAKDRELEAMSAEDWDETMETNVRGPMLCCKHVLPGMRAKGSGSIINFGSTAGVLGDVGLIAYSASKAAILGFSRGVATTYGKEGIRCNTVCPGSTWSQATIDGMGPETVEFMSRTRLTPRLGLPEDVAYMVAFLASDKAAYITGQTFMVDGGGTAHQPWVRVK